MTRSAILHLVSLLPGTNTDSDDDDDDDVDVSPKRNNRQIAIYLLGGMGPILWVWIMGGLERKRENQRDIVASTE